MSDILEQYLDNNSHNECALHYHRWAFISAVAANLGRNVYFPFGESNIYPNMYVVLMGSPASRKSTAVKAIEKIMRATNYRKFAFNKTSREKFLIDFAGGFDAIDQFGQLDGSAMLDVAIDGTRECYICSDEFPDFLGMRNTNFLSLLTTMWDNLDNYPERLKNSVDINIRNPTINILGGMTPQGLVMSVPPEMIGQGFTSRFILVHAAKPKKRVTFPHPLDPKYKQELIETFNHMQTMQGEVVFSAAGRKLLDDIYQNYDVLRDVRLHHYCSRRLTHLIKLCIVLAALRGTLIIDTDTIERANTILFYTERNMSLALGEFGEGRNSKAAQKVMETLQAAEGPVEVEKIWAAVSQDVDKSSVLNEIITNLFYAGRIQRTDVEGKACVMLDQRLLGVGTPGVNYNRWIQEFSSLSKGGIIS